MEGNGKAREWETANHDTIKSNIQRILWNLLRGSNCRAYSSDMKVYISETRYLHPDVTVMCDPRDRGRVQAIQSPRLIVKVLSPTTELTDRTWKLQNYCAHPTIEEYVLVDSQSLKIESYNKEKNSRVNNLSPPAYWTDGEEKEPVEPASMQFFGTDIPSIQYTSSIKATAPGKMKQSRAIPSIIRTDMPTSHHNQSRRLLKRSTLHFFGRCLK